MSPKAYSYPTLASNGIIFVAPYGMQESLHQILILNPANYDVKFIDIKVSDVCEKWTHGIEYADHIWWLPYNENYVLKINIYTLFVTYLPTISGYGKWISPHIYNDKIIALPYGEHQHFDSIIIIDTKDDSIEYVEIKISINDEKKWHTTQIVDNIIHGMPRGESVTQYFPYRIEFNCDTNTYKLYDLSYVWNDYDAQQFNNKKYTTMAKHNNTLWAPPYSENSQFDILAQYKNGDWQYIRTGLQNDSRKYFSHTVAKNGKIFFPPAGHEESWCEMLVINGITNKWHTLSIEIGIESKKYFAGAENSKGKIYYLPRGGCACTPKEYWKQYGDLTAVLVIDTTTEEYYTIDISEYFIDNTTIEKYNSCVIYKDIIFAFPYGESNTFQTILIFDTIIEKVIKTIDLNLYYGL